MALPVIRLGPECLRSTGCSLTVGWHLPEQSVTDLTQGYELEMDQGFQGSPFRLIAKLDHASQLSWTQHNLKPNSLYAFRVRANSLRGDSDWSPVTRLKTTLPSQDELSLTPIEELNAMRRTSLKNFMTTLTEVNVLCP